MNKTIQILRIISAASWLCLLTLALFKPELDYRTPFIIATTVLVLNYGIEFVIGGEEIDRQTEEFDTKQGRNTESDSKCEL